MRRYAAVTLLLVFVLSLMLVAGCKKAVDEIDEPQGQGDPDRPNAGPKVKPEGPAPAGGPKAPLGAPTKKSGR